MFQGQWNNLAATTVRTAARNTFHQNSVITGISSSLQKRVAHLFAVGAVPFPRLALRLGITGKEPVPAFREEARLLFLWFAAARIGERIGALPGFFDDVLYEILGVLTCVGRTRTQILEGGGASCFVIGVDHAA